MSLNEGQNIRVRRFGRGSTTSLWTAAEDRTIRLLFPDYKALEQALRHRTFWALRRRAAHLGIVQRRHVWTNQEVSRLRKLYPTASHEALQESFPRLSHASIKTKARDMALRRRPKGFKPTGSALLDELRERCFELKLSMVDLDDMAGTKEYFYRGTWRRAKSFDYARIAAGVHAIGGTLKADWGESE